MYQSIIPIHEHPSIDAYIKGNLYSYLGYLDEDAPDTELCLLLLSTQQKPETFHLFQQCKQALAKDLVVTTTLPSSSSSSSTSTNSTQQQQKGGGSSSWSDIPDDCLLAAIRRARRSYPPSQPLTQQQQQQQQQQATSPRVSSVGVGVRVDRSRSSSSSIRKSGVSVGVGDLRYLQQFHSDGDGGLSSAYRLVACSANTAFSSSPSFSSPATSSSSFALLCILRGRTCGAGRA